MYDDRGPDQDFTDIGLELASATLEVLVARNGLNFGREVREVLEKRMAALRDGGRPMSARGVETLLAFSLWEKVGISDAPSS